MDIQSRPGDAISSSEAEQVARAANELVERIKDRLDNDPVVKTNLVWHDHLAAMAASGIPSAVEDFKRWCKQPAPKNLIRIKRAFSGLIPSQIGRPPGTKPALSHYQAALEAVKDECRADPKKSVGMTLDAHIQRGNFGSADRDSVLRHLRRNGYTVKSIEKSIQNTGQ